MKPLEESKNFCGHGSEAQQSVHQGHQQQSNVDYWMNVCFQDASAYAAGKSDR